MRSKSLNLFSFYAAVVFGMSGCASIGTNSDVDGSSASFRDAVSIAEIAKERTDTGWAITNLITFGPWERYKSGGFQAYSAWWCVDSGPQASAVVDSLSRQYCTLVSGKFSGEWCSDESDYPLFKVRHGYLSSEMESMSYKIYPTCQQQGKKTQFAVQVLTSEGSDLSGWPEYAREMGYRDSFEKKIEQTNQRLESANRQAALNAEMDRQLSIRIANAESIRQKGVGSRVCKKVKSDFGVSVYLADVDQIVGSKMRVLFRGSYLEGSSGKLRLNERLPDVGWELLTDWYLCE